MTQQYDNTNRGALFVNEKRTQPNHPNYTGMLNVGGVEYWLSGWTKESKSGKKFLSLSIKIKDGQTSTGLAPTASGDGFLDQGGTATPAATKPADRGIPGGASDYDDDIPF